MRHFYHRDSILTRSPPRFIAKMSKASQFRCFAAWVAHHQETKVNKNIVKKFVARMNANSQ